MLFNSLSFAIFFIVTFAVYWSLPHPSRNRFLTFASLVFYTMWIPVYSILLLATLSLNYLLLQGILRSARPRAYLIASIAVSLALLAWFKYAAFAVESSNIVLESIGAQALPVPSILLPLGISFFTFQIIGLAVDAYRNRGVVAASYGEYLLFLSFFPHQIAGPILRGWNLLPQFRHGGVLTPERTHRAIRLIIMGMAKKVVFADALLAPYVNRVFGSPGYTSGAEHLVAVYSFAFQIYFDFSGYTDVARGIALLLGYELPRNFLEPYLSRSPSEFWRRWHITLSEWLRDYLYIPLGGNRLGPSRTYVNLMITMLLGGIWHGAGWNFLVWGAIHGTLLVLWRATRQREPANDDTLTLSDLPRIAVMFHATCLAWIFFRAPTFTDAMKVLNTILTGPYLHYLPVFQVLVLLTCGALHVVERRTRLFLSHEMLEVPVAEGLLLGATFAIVILFAGFGGSFIYFQF